MNVEEAVETAENIRLRVILDYAALPAANVRPLREVKEPKTRKGAECASVPQRDQKIMTQDAGCTAVKKQLKRRHKERAP
ncbi:unnamed protein product [Heligmosomoides polygyrus]|uniref:TPP_enzyme_N domain-containing protein n=1 Tax=Heligmosomoides polygyrus TaxID=6339 RepID=A0A183FN56_HELPZ|nr:unnamed protein product [Heligmosomoides polygyrus]